MPRRLVAALVALLVALLLVVAWLRAGPATAPPPGPAPAGPATLGTATASPRPLRQRAWVQLLPAAPEAHPAPSPAGAFEGRVRSALDGRGLAEAQLTFSSGQGAATASAGPGGLFRFEPPRAGRWWLAAVTAPGHRPFAPEWGQSPVQLEARAGETVRGLMVTLQPLEPIAGRVVGPAGEPVEGALVTVLGGGLGASPLVPLPDPQRTGPDGAFLLDAPEEAVLEARREGFATGRARVDYAVRVSRKVVIRLSPLAGDAASLAISGVVEDAAGLPAEGALVSAWPASDPAAPPALAHADAQGAFRLAGLSAGAFALTASRADLAPARAEVEAGAAGVRLRLTPGGRLEGRVRDRASGAAVVLFTVVVEGAAPRLASVVDGEGRFELGGLLPGEARVRVLAPGYAHSPEARLTVPEAGGGPARLEVALGRGGRITGRVVERGGGAPIAGARIEVEGSPSSGGVPVRNETASDDDGRFTLDAVADGAIGLFVSAAGHHARVLSAPPVRDGETVGPLTVELGAVAPGEDPRVELTGIGAGLEKRGEVLRVTMVAPGGGAAEAGLAPGDEVLAIDGASVRGWSLGDAIPRIRGPEGSWVTLLVVKAGDPGRTPVLLRVPRRLVRG